jgi:hypothetical protein
MLANIIYNNVTTGRGWFNLLEGGDLALIEEHNYYKTFECIINQSGDIALKILVINTLDYLICSKVNREKGSSV